MSACMIFVRCWLADGPLDSISSMRAKKKTSRKRNLRNLMKRKRHPRREPKKRPRKLPLSESLMILLAVTRELKELVGTLRKKAPAAASTRGTKKAQQSQLDFAPSRSTGTRGGVASTSRAKSKPIEIDDSSEEVCPCSSNIKGHEGRLNRCCFRRRQLPPVEPNADDEKITNTRD